MTLLSVLDTYVSGVSGSGLWDLTKATWKRLNQRNWEELYLDAFEAALEDERPRLQKYGDGDVLLERKTLHRVLHQDLGAAVSLMPLTQLTDDQFAGIVAATLSEREALIIGGHHLGQHDYEQLVHNIVQNAIFRFKSSVAQDPDAFRKAMVAEAQDNKALVRKTQNYLVDRFGLLMLKLDHHTNLLEEILANQQASSPKPLVASPATTTSITAISTPSTETPDMTHSPNLLPSKALTRAEKRELVQCLFDIPHMTNREQRATVLAELRAEISTNIRYNPTDRGQIFNIVNTCLNYSGGMQELREALQDLEGDSDHMQRFEQVLNRLFAA